MGELDEVVWVVEDWNYFLVIVEYGYFGLMNSVRLVKLVK